MIFSYTIDLSDFHHSDSDTTDPTVPNTMQVEFAISNHNFTSDLQNSSSSEYIKFTSQFCKEVSERDALKIFVAGGHSHGKGKANLH